MLTMRAMVRPRWQSGAGKRGRSRLPSRSSTASIARIVPSLSMRNSIVAREVDAEDHARYGAVHDPVDRPGRLVVGVARVEHDAVGLHVHGEADLERAVALAVGLDLVGELVAAWREGAAQPRAHDALGLLVQALEGVEHQRAAEAAEQVEDATLAQPHRGGEGARVALEQQREAGIADEEAEDLLVEHAFAIEAHRRDHQPFLEHLGRGRRHRARPGAADVVEMRPGLRERRELAVDEHRRGEHLVVEMRHAAVGRVAVVVPVEIARPHGVGRILVEDRLDDVAEQRQRRAGDEPAGGIEIAREEIFLLADHVRHRGALDQRLHLRTRGDQGALDDLERDRIAGRGADGSGGVVH